jgi:hypothetical protein
MRTMIAILGLLAAPAFSLAQEAPDADPLPAREPAAPTGAQVIAQKWGQRLTSLRPESPEAYFFLGEEVLDGAQSEEERRLAVELFTLTFELDRARGGVPSLAASACIALASCTTAERDREWLIALARSLDSRRSVGEWLGQPPPRSTQSAAYQVATVMGLVRAGNGAMARQLLGKPEVAAALQANDRLLMAMGVRSGASGIVRESKRWGCTECQNERIVKRTQTNPPDYRLCGTCAGNPGTQTSVMELIAQLRFEAWLLQGDQRSWAAQVTVDHGAVLRDPSPEAVGDAFGVDTKKTLWRKGVWVEPLVQPAPQPMPAQPDAPDAAAPDNSEPPQGDG